MGPQELGLSGLWGRLDEDGGGDGGVGDGDLAIAAGPKPENKSKTMLIKQPSHNKSMVKKNNFTVVHTQQVSTV
jgi:hypothetical protein